MNKITAFVAAVVVASVFGATHPAAAAQPITTIEKFDRTFYFDCPQGFTAIEHFVGKETIRRFADGTQQAQELVNVTLTNSLSGLVLTSETPFKYTFDHGTLTTVGVTLRILVPGVGIVALAAGKLVYDEVEGEILFDSGPSDSLPNICTVLSSEHA